MNRAIGAGTETATRALFDFQNKGLITLDRSSILSEARKAAGQRSKSCLSSMLEIADIVERIVCLLAVTASNGSSKLYTSVMALNGDRGCAMLSLA